MNLRYDIGMDTQGETLRDRLQKLISRRGLSLGQIEIGAKVTKSQLSLFLSGKRPNMYVDVVARLADYFDVSLDYLTGASDDPRPLHGQIPADFGAFWDIYQGMTPRQRFQLRLQARLINDDLSGIVEDIAQFGDVKHEKVVAELEDEGVEDVQPQPVGPAEMTRFELLLDILVQRHGENEADEIIKILNSSDSTAAMGATARRSRRDNRREKKLR
jgi:transcriptional regulator with XRE-family HTH domain